MIVLNSLSTEEQDGIQDESITGPYVRGQKMHIGPRAYAVYSEEK